MSASITDGIHAGQLLLALEQVEQECLNADRPRQLPDFTDVQIIDQNLSYEEFFTRFMVGNRPCLVRRGYFKQLDILRRHLCGPDDDVETLLYHLNRTHGHEVMPITRQTSENPSESVEQMRFDQFAADKLQPHCSGQFFPDADGYIYYCKDWHFYRTGNLSADERTYCMCPEHMFSSDWLNEYMFSVHPSGERAGDDYMFMYIGTENSYTALHTDVLASFSWSYNIYGSKRWWFYSPNSGMRMTVDQGPGETIFVPSQVRHRVLNMSQPTCSTNRNWYNASNFNQVYYLVRQGLEQARRETDCDRNIVELEQWQISCQRIVKASEGMDMADLVRNLKIVLVARLRETDVLLRVNPVSWLITASSMPKLFWCLIDIYVAYNHLVTVRIDKAEVMRGTRFWPVDISHHNVMQDLIKLLRDLIEKMSVGSVGNGGPINTIPEDILEEIRKDIARFQEQPSTSTATD